MRPSDSPARWTSTSKCTRTGRASTGSQHCVRAHTGPVGEEGTLHDFVVLALESLGGALGRPISAERRKRCAGTLNPARVRARHRTHRRLWITELLKAPA